MARVEIIGLEKVSYKKKDGTQVEGVNLNYVEPLPNKEDGLRCTREYVASKRLPSDLKLGDAELTFGRGFNGSSFIEKVTMVEK